jgi:hypothetical protein
MAQLLFFDEGHKYTLDGEELPSVSELTRFISREIYGDVGQFNLDRAADRGTAVHKATELLDKYGTVEIDEDISPYLKAYIAFRKEHKCEWQKIEYATHHPENLYAGTLDRVGTVDGKLAILDIKTSSTIQKPLYTAQLNLYREMLPDPIEQLIILHLRKDGTYKLIDIPIDDTLADACITMHEALKKKKRSKKNA